MSDQEKQRPASPELEIASAEDLAPDEKQSEDVKGGALNAYGPKQRT